MVVTATYIEFKALVHKYWSYILSIQNAEKKKSHSVFGGLYII